MKNVLKCTGCSVCASTQNNWIYPICEDSKCKIRYSECSHIEILLQRSLKYETSHSDMLSQPDYDEECNNQACVFHLGK